jgi:hypothetical protein
MKRRAVQTILPFRYGYTISGQIVGHPTSCKHLLASLQFYSRTTYTQPFRYGYTISGVTCVLRVSLSLARPPTRSYGVRSSLLLEREYTGREVSKLSILVERSL